MLIQNLRTVSELLRDEKFSNKTLSRQDVPSQQAYPFGNETLLAKGEYVGIATDQEYLYLMPANAKDVLQVDLRNKDFTHIELPGHVFPELNETWKWITPIVAQGKLFGCPHNVHHVLVMELHTRTFRRIDTPPQKQSRGLWWGMIDFEGMLYTAPNHADDILVINAASETVEAQINVRAFGQGEWRGPAAFGKRIYFAPTGSSEHILVWDTGTKELAAWQEQHCFEFVLISFLQMPEAIFFDGF